MTNKTIVIIKSQLFLSLPRINIPEIYNDKKKGKTKQNKNPNQIGKK